MESLLLILADNESDPPLVWGMPMWLAWLVIIILMLISSTLALCENAYSTCNKYHFRAEAEKGKRTAKIITSLVDKFDDTLVAVLVTFNTISTITSFISAIIWLNIAKSNNWVEGMEAIVSTVVMGLMVYVITDTIPKVISRQIPDKVAVLMAYPLKTLEIILFPIIWIFRKLLSMIHKMLHLQDENLLSKEDFLFEVNQAINDEEVEDDSDEEEREKLFEKDETEIIDNVLSFDQLTVSKIYVPLDKVYSLDIDGLTTEKVNQAILDTEYSRLPIYEGSKDNIIGVLVLRLYFNEYMKDKHLSIRSMLEDVPVFTLDMSLDKALETMNNEKVHLGVVKKNDQVIGIVTMENILEEVVEDISEDPTLDPIEEKIDE